jgi:hypothetical protein
MCLASVDKFYIKAKKDAKADYGENALIRIFTRKNYLKNAIRNGLPAGVKEDVIQIFEKMVSQSRIITFLGGLLVGMVKYKRLQDPQTQNLPYTGKLHGLYNEVNVSYLLSIH